MGGQLRNTRNILGERSLENDETGMVPGEGDEGGKEKANRPAERQVG